MSRLKDVELDVAQLLVDAGLGILSGSAPTLFPGPFPASAPDAFITCRKSGGDGPERYLANVGSAYHWETVTVLVRGERGPDAYTASRTTAYAAWEALFEAQPSGYVRLVAEDSGPNWLGEDEDGRPQWSFTFSLEYASAGA